MMSFSPWSSRGKFLSRLSGFRYINIVEDILVDGAKRARKIAAEVMERVREASGIVVAAGTHP